MGGKEAKRVRELKRSGLWDAAREQARKKISADEAMAAAQTRKDVTACVRASQMKLAAGLNESIRFDKERERRKRQKKSKAGGEGQKLREQQRLEQKLAAVKAAKEQRKIGKVDAVANDKIKNAKQVDAEGENDVKDDAGHGEETNHDDGLTIFVGQLAYDVDAPTVKKHFESAGIKGKVTVRLLTQWQDDGTKKSKGMAFVRLKSEEDVKTALELHQTDLNGRKMNVERATGWVAPAKKRGKKKKVTADDDDGNAANVTEEQDEPVKKRRRKKKNANAVLDDAAEDDATE